MDFEMIKYTLPFGGKSEHSVSGTPPCVGAQGGFYFQGMGMKTQPETLHARLYEGERYGQ